MFTNVWLIPMLPLAAAGVVGLLGRRISRAAGWITSLAVLGALAFSLRIFMEMLPQPAVHETSWLWLRTAGAFQLEAGWLLDPLSCLMLVIVTFVSLMIQVYSLGYMEGDPGISRYFAYLSLFTFSMLGLVLANNLVLLYMFWELVGLSSFLLIGFWYAKPSAANAAKKAFVVTRFGDMGLLVAILILAGALGTVNIREIGHGVAAHVLSLPLLTAVAILIFAGAAGKSAQFPLHIWLPDAMEGPTPVSALIHAATMVAAGVFLVARTFPVFQSAPDAMTVVAYLGGFTSLFAATIACVQTDIKRIMAYSTLSQLGYMMLALGCGGYAAGMFHLTTHAFFKALLFLIAGAVIHSLHTNEISEMGGLRKSMPWTTSAVLAAALALSGIFPFSGFFSKDAILSAVWESGRADLLAVGLLTAMLTTFYIFRMFFTVFTGTPSGSSTHRSGKVHEAPWVMRLPMLLLMIPTVLAGFWERGFMKFLSAAWGAPGVSSEPHATWIPLAAFAAAVAGFSLAYAMYYRKSLSPQSAAKAWGGVYTLVLRKYYVDEFYGFLVRRGMFVLSRGLAWFDRRVVDGAVNGVGACCRAAGEGLRRVQAGRVQAYLVACVIGFLVIAVSILIANPALTAFVK